MDLRAMLNESGPAPPATPIKAPAQYQQQQPPPHQQHQQQHQQQALPSTPVGNGPQNAFRDFRSPVRAMPNDYQQHQQQQHAPFASPPSYPQTASYGGPGRAPPPPPQPLPSNDMRSPSAGSLPGPQYRHTPLGSSSGPSGGYPFPESASPIQQHRYSSSGAYPTRESFSQASGHSPSQGPPGQHHPAYYQGQPPPPPPQQQHHPMPQTPPVNTSVGANPYLHQRSQSTHSTPTPTSAQSQHPPYGPHYASPIATNHPLPPSEHHLRQASQPHTPLGPPPSAGSRHSSGPGSFAQPPSPYQQQRLPSAGAYPPPYPQQHQHQQQQQASPHMQVNPHPQHPQLFVQRNYENAPIHQHHPADPHRRSLSQSERERSVSVSPKTRIPSLPSSSGHRSQSSISGPSGPAAEYLDLRDPREPRHHPPNNAPRMDSSMSREHELERATILAKRKMDDRDLRPEEIDRQQPRPPPFEANGSHVPTTALSRPSVARSSTSPMLARRKRRHAVPPAWAQVYDAQPLKKPNFVLRRPPNSHAHVNGKAEPPTFVARQDRSASRQVSPEASRSVAPAALPLGIKLPTILGEWEPTIIDQKPVDQMAEAVAIYFISNVTTNHQLANIHGSDIQFEIEAKLGIIKDKITNERLNIGCVTECVVASDRFAFDSSMTESYHKTFNEFLNKAVADAHPKNPTNQHKGRVAINYRHRRQVDKFYHISPAMRQALHPAVQQLLGTKSAKVRVSYEKGTDNVLAKIIKAKVADLHIHFPRAELDCRISINVEAKWDGPVEELQQMAEAGNGYRESDDRHKDRMSYRQGLYQVDLTQVTSTIVGANKTQQTHKTHELEIELDADALLEHSNLYLNTQPNDYEFLVDGFVDNVRMLAKRGKPEA